MRNLIDDIKAKIFYSVDEFVLLQKWKDNKVKIVFTNGCFDLIHRGHVEYLVQAAAMGDVLLVGLNSDASVRRLKGNQRPVHDQFARSLVLAAFGFVAAVVIFDEDTPYNLIQFCQPDILVKGADYAIENIVGQDIVLAKGGEVRTIDFVNGFSTSSIIDTLKKS